mgnify:CR=1 FL=1
MYMLGWGGGIDRRHLHPSAGAVERTTERATATTTTAATRIPKLDELVAKVKVDMDPDVRLKEIRDALAAHNAEINHLPLHRQVIPVGGAQKRDRGSPRRQPGHAVLGEGAVGTVGEAAGRRQSAAASTAFVTPGRKR